jgi:serine/threonine protein kinase
MCFLVLELLAGGELFERLRGRDGHVHNERLVAKYSREIFEALAYCHANKVISYPIAYLHAGTICKQRSVLPYLVDRLGDSS